MVDASVVMEVRWRMRGKEGGREEGEEAADGLLSNLPSSGKVMSLGSAERQVLLKSGML